MRNLMRIILVTLCLALSVPTGGTARAQETTDPGVTAIAFQPFQHGYMLWREDEDKFAVVYTDIATKIGAPCQEVYRDTFDGQDYTIPDSPPGLLVPVRGFGQVWLATPYVRDSLGFPLSGEIGAFATVTYETFPHPTRGTLVVRTMKLRTDSGAGIAVRDTYPDFRTADLEPRESRGCAKILIPHRACWSPRSAHPARHEQGQELTVPAARFERSVR